MALDWLTTLGVGDQSLEGQLARRDLSKKAALVQNLAKMQEDVRSQQEQEQYRRDALQEQMLLRRATMAQTQAYRDEMTRRANVDDERQDYNTLSDNLARQVSAGVAPVLNDAQAGLMARHGEGGSITDQQVAGSPPGEGNDADIQMEHIYRQHEAEAAALKAKQAETIRQAQEKRAQRDQQLQEREMALREQANKRAEAEEARRVQREKDRQQAVLDKRKQLDANLAKLPPQMAPAVKARAEQIIQEKSSWLDSLPWADKEDSVTDAWVQAYNETVAKVHPGVVKDAPLGPGAAIPAGRGAGAGTGGGAGEYLSPEEVKQKFPQLPPGARVRRVK